MAADHLSNVIFCDGIVELGKEEDNHTFINTPFTVLKNDNAQCSKCANYVTWTLFHKPTTLIFILRVTTGSWLLQIITTNYGPIFHNI